MDDHPIVGAPRAKADAVTAVVAGKRASRHPVIKPASKAVNKAVAVRVADNRQADIKVSVLVANDRRRDRVLPQRTNAPRLNRSFPSPRRLPSPWSRLPTPWRRGANPCELSRIYNSSSNARRKAAKIRDPK